MKYVHREDRGNSPSSIFERWRSDPSPSRYCRKARHIRLSAVRDKVLLCRTAFTPRAGACARIFPALGCDCCQAISPIWRSACNG
jgi:hypothetical protein